MKCTNCLNTGATKYTYNSVTSYLCADCREKLSLAIAGFNRYKAVMLGLLMGRRT